MSAFGLHDIPDLSGRRVIITGANSGIGLEAARGLASRGAQVVMAVRDLDRGRAAAQAVGGTTDVRQLDLASLASIRAFADAWDGEADLLINNAGVMVPPLGRTADGFELQFGTNHLGHFALTNLLLPRITGRVVTVSSSAHRPGSIDFDDLNWERKRYRRMAAYSQSKLANLLFTSELQRRLTKTGSRVLSVAAHPGYANTNLQSHTENQLVDVAMSKVVNRFFAQSAANGALPTLYAALADIPGNSYAGPGGFQELRGAPVLVGRTKRALDPEVASRLWSVSEELTGTEFPL